MNLPGRVQAFAERHGLWTRASRSWRRCLAEPIPSRCSCSCTSWRRGPSRACRRRPSAPSHPRRRGRPDAGFVGHLAGRLGLPCRSWPTTTSPHWHSGRGASLEVAGRKRGSRSSSVSPTGPPARSSPWRTRAATRPKPSCSGSPVGPGRAAWPACRPASGHRVRPLLDVGREELRDWLRERGRALAGGPDQRGHHHRAQSASGGSSCRAGAVEPRRWRKRSPARPGSRPRTQPCSITLATAEAVRTGGRRRRRASRGPRRVRQLPEALARRVSVRRWTPPTPVHARLEGHRGRSAPAPAGALRSGPSGGTIRAIGCLI